MIDSPERCDAAPTTPMAVLHVPHTSVEIPADVRRAILLSEAELDRELLRMTDRYTDELFEVESSIAASVVYPVSRLVVDPERFDDDALEPMVARGMGVIYTRTSQQSALRMPPDEVERERLLARYYRPHHARITSAVDAILEAHGRCLVLDCHSFATRALPYEMNQSGERPEICLGTDAFHTPPALAATARWEFEREGFTVAFDTPFAGALVPSAHYGRDHRVGALMVEINRGVYMNEATGERLTTFEDVRRRVSNAVLSVLEVWRSGTDGPMDSGAQAAGTPRLQRTGASETS